MRGWRARRRGALPRRRAWPVRSISHRGRRGGQLRVTGHDWASAISPMAYMRMSTAQASSPRSRGVDRHSSQPEAPAAKTARPTKPAELIDSDMALLLAADTTRNGLTSPVPTRSEAGHPCYLPFGFGGVLIVSTTLVLGRRSASFTGMNSPVFASRPILRDPINPSGASTGRNCPCAWPDDIWIHCCKPARLTLSCPSCFNWTGVLSYERPWSYTFGI